MWHRRSLIPWPHLIALTFMTAGPLLLADDQPTTSDGYKIVSVNTGDGKSLPVRVQEGANPYKNISSSNSGKYDPESPNFSATSSMADKTFALPSDALAKGDPDFKNSDQNTFATKPYNLDSSSTTDPNLNTKASVPATSAYNRTDSDFDKSYTTVAADTGQDRTSALASTTSADQNRTAAIGNQTADTYASPLGDKVFRGDEADAVHRHLSKTANGQIMVTDLPDRPLTIDEVRDLINHGFKPNTDAPPQGEPSKPLNDPDYKPQPLRETPPPATDDNDKDDPIPSPGTMAAPAAPENSEPLPQP